MNGGRLRAALPFAIVLAASSLAAACRRAPPPDATAPPTGTSPTTSPTGTPGTPGSSGNTPASFDKRALLRSVGECALSRYRHFDGAARGLRDAARAHATARTPENKTAFANAWKTAMASWQEAELFRLGPAASSTLPGGADLRDSIYAYPLFSRCKVEEQLVAKTYETPAFPTSLVSARGLGTLEYLAFYEAADNACSPTSPINANGSWAALTPEDLAQRKADYARASADDIAARASALVGAWDPAAGNFVRALAEPGTPGSPYATEADALNAVSDAMFYVEREVKDIKLARPLGVSPDCTTTRCPEAVESPWAHASNAHLRANLVAFRRIFEGCADDGSGLGFDDWLRAVGAGALADRMIAALANARAAVDALDVPLEQAIVTSPAKADALYAAVKALTDPLKTDFITVLDLELPKVSQGDND